MRLISCRPREKCRCFPRREISFDVDWLSHITSDDEGAAVGGGDDLEEVAADLTEGLVDGLDGKAGNSGVLSRDQYLLDGARRFEFALGVSWPHVQRPPITPEQGFISADCND